MDEEKKKKVVSLFKEASKPRRTPQPVGPGTVIVVNASGQAQAAGRDIHNHHYSSPPRAPRVTVVPGDGVISEEQKVALTALRDEWITLHASIKRRPLSHGAAWARINKAAGATSYHLIKAENFDAALAYVRRQIAILRGTASAPKKDAAWRAKRIGSIKLHCRNRLGDEYAYGQYIRRRFGVGSLADLSSDQLQQTYAYVMGKKRAGEP